MQSEECLSDEKLSEERLSPSLIVDDENFHETRDLLLKLEVDEAYSDDNHDDKDDTDLQSGNEDTSPHEDKEVRK